ncbi:MAG: PLP-dependent aminotransferase family protein [Lachnospiraceae bacterium]|nr:PLP-dependent aminotransferase family protein [Lachnospiraceae bacterium]
MLTIYLDSHSNKPYYEQIYRYIRDEIRNGHLACHEKLPSSRGLAQHLNVSRSTVDTAYAQLVAEGYIESFPKRGYFVSQIDELLNMVPVAYPPVSAVEPQEEAFPWDFSPTGADALNFPDTYWRKLSRECINYDDGTIFRSSEPQGDMGLRQELVNYLRQNRGVSCSPDNIIIGAGSQYLMMLLLRLLGKNSRIAMENPAYMPSYYTFQSLEREVIPISVDDHGMSVEELQKSDANIAYVTPSHQYPLGVVMPVSRRTKLLNWANYEPDRYIIEDDYDSEFRYQGRPIPALQGMDQGKKVIYMGSFSKVVSPAVRMSYMVLPDSLMARYREIFKTFPSTVSRLDQAIMTRFMKEGYFERHLNRLRNRYKARHDVLIRELKQFKDRVRLSSINAGSYVVLEWTGEMTEEELLEHARQEGILLYPLSRFCIVPTFRMYPTFLMGFAQLSEEELQQGIGRLRRVWK